LKERKSQKGIIIKCVSLRKRGKTDIRKKRRKGETERDRERQREKESKKPEQ
jgi:hypothetical protein